MIRVVLAGSLLAACVSSNEVRCADGRLCPPGYQCDVDNMRCLSAEQVAACAGRDEGAECSVAGAPGACRRGACEPLVCGDGIRSVGEACDGEDFGESTCREAGFYDEPGLRCTEFCTFEVSQCTGRCGDLLINGMELCDGAPPIGACLDYGFDAGPVGCGGSCGITFEDCARFGWVPEPTGLVNAFSLDGTSPADLWVGGTTTTGDGVARFDGNSWTLMPLAGDATPLALAVAGADDAWIVRDAGGSAQPSIEHFVAGQWTVVAGVPVGDYKDIWAAGPTGVYIATADAGVLWWNGSAWQTLGTLTGMLAKIDGTSATDLWVARVDGTLEHWNGLAWTPMPVAIEVRQIEPLAVNDLWVSGTSTADPSAAAVGHWDGLQWTVTLDPSVNPSIGRRFTAIAASSRKDLWVAGPSGLARHFDGHNWSPAGVVVFDLASGSFSQMLQFDGTTLAITFDGRLYRYRGQMYARFNTQSMAPLRASVSFTPTNTVVIDQKNTAYHFDGVTWNPATIDTVVPAQNHFALWGRAPDDIWVGGSAGRIYRYNGGTWVDANSPTNNGIDAILGFAENDVWIVGASVHHFNGASYAPVPITTPTNFYAVAASGPDDVWVMNRLPNATEVWRWNGATWNMIGPPFAAELRSIVALAPNNAFAAAGNRIWHWDGLTWAEEAIGVLDSFQRMAATGPTDIFAITPREIVHFDGSRWSFLRAPLDVSVANRELTNISPNRDHIDLLYDVEFGGAPLRRLLRTRPWKCEDSETHCADGVDDDCDLQVDELDTDCP